MIEIDVQTIIPPEVLVVLDETIVYNTLRDVAEAARGEWIRLAQEELQTTRADYIGGIQRVQYPDKQTAILQLVGNWPNAIESGMDPYDMRDTLLGPNVKVVDGKGRGKRANKDGGFYRAVPFRTGAPGSQGRTFTNMYGNDPESAGNRAGLAIYARAQQLAGSRSAPRQGVAYGERLPAGLAPKLKETNVTDPFAGMIRMTKIYESAEQSQYMTFRTISTTGGNPESWMHPGLPARNLATKVAKYVEEMIPKAFEAYIAGIQGRT